MANKEFFRFLRGELNGWYLMQINDAVNLTVKEIKRFFTAWHNMQFNADMPEDYVKGLGLFAGVYIPTVDIGFQFFMFMTESFVADGVQRSERGLFNTNLERFEFVHTEHDDYSDDINTLATSTLKSSLVGDEEVLGYIAEDAVNVLLPDGTVNPDCILDTPPSGKSYTEYYGNQFLFLEETASEVNAELEKELYRQLIEAMQFVRYNHDNLVSLCKIIELLCPNGFIKITDIERSSSGCYVTIKYVKDLNVDIDHKTHRETMFKYVVSEKFPSVFLVEEV